MRLSDSQLAHMRDITYFEVSSGIHVERFTTKEEAIKRGLEFPRYSQPVIVTVLNSNVIVKSLQNLTGILI